MIHERSICLRLVFVLSLLSGTIFRVYAATGWVPTPTLKRDLLISNIAVTNHGALVSSATRLYRLPENSAAWKIDSQLNVNAMAATPSFHFIQANQVLSILDSAGRLRGEFPTGWEGFKQVAEDSVNLYLRLGNDSVYAANKKDMVWRPLTTVPNVPFLGTLMIFPNHILAATGGGLYRTQDRGMTWERVHALPGVYGFTLFQKADHEIFAHTYDGGFYRSADSGESWSPVFPDNSPFRQLHISGLVAAGDTLWVSDGSVSRNNLGVLRSLDRGRTWTQHYAGMTGVNELGVPGNPGFTYYPVYSLNKAGGTLWANNTIGQVFWSQDGGVTWVEAAAGLANDGVAELFVFDHEIRAMSPTELGPIVSTFNASTRRWVPDSSFLPGGGYYSLRISGDTIYAKSLNSVAIKPGKNKAWETFWSADGEHIKNAVDLYPMGTEMFLVEQNGQILNHSDDGGRTWRSMRPFLHKVRFKGQVLEARGNLLCWPDDSLFTPPKIWRDFSDKISGLWVVGEELAVRSGSSLFFATLSGGAWKDVPLPNTSMALSVRNGAMTGYTPDSRWRFDRVGNQWVMDSLHFPLLGVKAIAASETGLWVQNEPNGETRFYGMDGSSQGISFPGATLAMQFTVGGSYLMASWRGMIDTIANSALGARTGFRFDRTIPVDPSGIAAIFGDADFMAKASENRNFQVSKDRGKNWETVGVLPGRAKSISGSPSFLVCLTDESLRVSRDTGKTWLPNLSSISFVQAAGTADFFAALSDSGNILFTEDSLKSWKTLPVLPDSPSVKVTAIAVTGRQVYAGTQEHGVFRWGGFESSSLRDKSISEKALRGRNNQAGWVRVPLKSWQHELDNGSRVDIRGRIRASLKKIR